MAPPSTAILGRTGGGGTGRTVRIIQSGRAYDSESPRMSRSEVEIFLRTAWASDAVKRRLSGCWVFTSYRRTMLHLSYSRELGRIISYHLIIVLSSFVHQEQLQALLANLWLDMATPSVTASRFSHWIVVFFLRFVGFTGHLRLAMLPHTCHPLLGIGVLNFCFEIRVVLTTRGSHRSDGRDMRIGHMRNGSSAPWLRWSKMGYENSSREHKKRGRD